MPTNAVRAKRAAGGVAPNRILSRVRALVLGVKVHGGLVVVAGSCWLPLPAGAGRELSDRPPCLSTSAPRAGRKTKVQGLIQKFIRVTLRNPRRRRANTHLFIRQAVDWIGFISRAEGGR